MRATSPFSPTIAATLFGTSAVVLAIAASVPAHAAPLVETYAQAIAGQSANVAGCTTFSIPAPISTYFAAGAPGVANVSGSGNAACGVVGEDTHASSAASGNLSDSAALTNSFNSGANAFSGSAGANATSGKIGAKANGTFTGSTNSLIVEGAQAAAAFTEGLTITSAGHANGTHGTVVFKIGVDGKLSMTGANGYSEFDVNYGVNGASPNLLVRSQITSPTATPSVIAGGCCDDTAGFATGAGFAMGADDFTAYAVDIVFGTSFDLTVALLAYAIPFDGATADVDFFASAKITGIQVLLGAGITGPAVTDFTVTAASGAHYDANGVHLADTGTSEAPEPATLVLLGFGLAGLGLVCRRPLR